MQRAGEECSRKREQQVQSPCGRRELALLKNRKKDSMVGAQCTRGK